MLQLFAKQTLMQNRKQIFDYLISRASQPRYRQKVFDSCKHKYDIKAYKLGDLDTALVERWIKKNQEKHQSADHENDPFKWQENQKRLFIWFMMFYCFEFSEEPSQITQVEWKRISKQFFKKNEIFLQFQARNLEKAKQKSPWDKRENDLLKELVNQYGLKRWNQVSKHLFFKSNREFFKTSKQCRERWFNHLDKAISKDQMTPQEDYKLLTYVKKYGKKWAGISRILSRTRTQHQVKNRYNSLVQKFRKNNSAKQQEEEIVQVLLETIRIQNPEACVQIEDPVVKIQMESESQNQEKPPEIPVKIQEDPIIKKQEEVPSQIVQNQPMIKQEQQQIYPNQLFMIPFPYNANPMSPFQLYRN